MNIHIYNTCTRQKETLKPIHPGEVRLYVCGNTVYDDAHIGHARVFVAFDVVVRFLTAMGYKVHYVRNITDIDDKIIARAKEQGESIEALTTRYIQRLHEDTAALGTIPPTAEPKATEQLGAMIQMIAVLMEKGMAYVGSNGDVYYRVTHFKGYGALSNRKLEDLQEGARVEVDLFKENPLDFVLWKQAKPNEIYSDPSGFRVGVESRATGLYDAVHEDCELDEDNTPDNLRGTSISWEAPWGRGRPGWHIECSAMSTTCLGNHFDIHGGGADLLFPHHENERAQSEAATGETFVNTWMHVGFVQVSGDKMSKSLNNFFTIREVLKEFDAEVLRYFLLASHYRSPVNYSREALEMAKQSLTRLYTALKGLEVVTTAKVEAHYQVFIKAMADDFNTPVALTVLFDMAHAIHKTDDLSEKRALASTLKQAGQILGLFNRPVDVFLQSGIEALSLSVETIEALISERAAARFKKDWARSDHIRDDLLAAGVILEDTGGTTVWRRK